MTLHRRHFLSPPDTEHIVDYTDQDSYTADRSNHNTNNNTCT